MTQRLPLSALRVAVALVWLAAATAASEVRHTPMVRAIKRAENCVVNIHSEKTSFARETVFSSGKGRKINGMGTGVVVDERGYIVTNFHVIAEVDSLRATLRDGSSYDARVISFDREHDLAIIKVDASKPLAIMPLGTSSDLMLGETVIAVGNAFGYEHTITAGIISALNRNVEVNETQSYRNLIQTDASINPGNSGGPLLNLDGDVVGINVAIRAGAQRIGFAIPIDDARKVIARLLSVEQLNQTQHGLITRDVKSAEQQMLVVNRTQPHSPAQAAGFQAGDVVLKAADVEVVDAADLERALLGRPAGEKVKILVRRNDQNEQLVLALKARPGNPEPDPPVVRANNATPEAERIWAALGVRLAPLPAADRHIVGPRYRGGMRITSVRDGSPAAANGIQDGDVLVGLHLWETINFDNVLWILNQPQAAGNSSLKFYIVRGEETLYGHLQVSAVQR